MKKYFSILISAAALLSISSALYSADWEAKKVKILSDETRDTEIRLSLSDENGYNFTLKYTGEVSDTQADIILKLNRDFRQWKIVRPSRIDFVITNDVIEGIVIPSALTYNKQNYLANVPSGLIFAYGDYLEYNFRVSKNNFFVRINDRFTTEEAMCENIADVVKNPKEYLKKREPDYLFRRLEKLETEHKKLQEQVTQLDGNMGTFADSHEKLIYAVMTIHNTGFLGFGKNPIDKKVITRVIDMKKANPGMTKKEISENLEKEKIELSEKGLELILNVYFNEFD
jgi:hypothetical protein